MRVVRSLLVVLLVAVGVLAAPTNKRSTSNDGQQSNNVIQQVIKALAKRDNMNRVIDYLEKTEEDLIEKLPTVGSGKYSRADYTLLIILFLVYYEIVRVWNLNNHLIPLDLTCRWQGEPVHFLGTNFVSLQQSDTSRYRQSFLV